MKTPRLQQGDSFAMNFIIKDNEQPKDIQSNEDLAVGLYDEYGYKAILKLSEGDIKHANPSGGDSKPGQYRAFVSGDITKNFIGYVDLEIVVYDKSRGYDERNVSHADKVLKLFFEERKINDDIQ